MAKRRKIHAPKKTHWINYVVILGLLACFLVALSFYLLPFVRYYQLEKAISTRDAGTIVNYLNRGELKENILKRRATMLPVKKATAQAGPLSIVDLAVQWYEKAARPDFERSFTTEGIYALMAELGKGAEEEEDAWRLANRVIRNTSFSYQSLDRFSLKVKDLQGRFVGYVTFDFAREGLNWQLVDIQFPLF